MAEFKLPIQINLPDDWLEQIVNRLRNDPEAEWVEITRCKDCKYYKLGYDGIRYCFKHDDDILWDDDDFCSKAERRTDERLN